MTKLFLNLVAAAVEKAAFPLQREPALFGMCLNATSRGEEGLNMYTCSTSEKRTVDKSMRDTLQIERLQTPSCARRVSAKPCCLQVVL